MKTRGSAWLLSLAIFGCGDGSHHGPVAEDELVPAIASTVCDLQAQCDCDTPLSGDQCRAALEQALEMFLVPPPDAGLTYDAQCGGEAAGIYEDLGCGMIEDLLDEDVCRPCKLYYGDKQAGAACTTYPDTIFDDCGRGLVCAEVCVDPCDPAGEGEPCIGRRCADGMICTVSLDETTHEPISACERTAGAGESCETLSCRDELVCDPESLACVVPPPVGQPCTGSCATNAWCDTTGDFADWICRAPKADGEDCMDDDECTGTCDDGTAKCIPDQPFVCEVAGG